MNGRVVPAAAALCLLALSIGCDSRTTPTAPSPAAPPMRIIGVSGDLAFGSVEVGQPAIATLTITNSGNAALTVTGVTVTTDGYALSWATGTIPPNGSQSIIVRFTPTSEGDYNGVLTVHGDQTGGTNTASVSGSARKVAVMELTISAQCGAVTAGTYALACVVSVTIPGVWTSWENYVVVADLGAFGLSGRSVLPWCGPCGVPNRFDLVLHVPADMPAGTVPVTITASDKRGRPATTTVNLQVVR